LSRYFRLNLEILYWTFVAPFRGERWKVSEVFHQMILIGTRALPMAALTAFSIGLTLAMQSARELQKLGAASYVPDLVSVSLLRELGPLIIAVIVIGRSGSAVTAELGTMKVGEEIEALEVMAINPVRFLIVPRVLAMMIMLPALTVFGNCVGMVGGSTLLPEVYPKMEARFGRDRVRAWQPFEAVAYGAAAYAAGVLTQSDLIVHDYAFLTYDPKTNDPRHTLIVPRGTRVPTAMDLWKRQLVPTCALGEPERLFKLVIAEIGQAEPDERRFAWDEAGTLKKIGGQGEAAQERIVVPLNADNPTLGELEPPHAPGDKRPRLEIAFGVNAERWLVGTVRDLHANRLLMSEKPVVRLL